MQHTARPSMLRRLRRISLAALLGFAACQPNAAPEAVTAGDTPELRTYTVSPALTKQLDTVLTLALDTGKDTPPLGTVEHLPDGRLVVVAPPAIHNGIGDLIGGLDMSKFTSPRSAELEYWFVVGEPAAPGSEPASIPELDAALAAVTKAQGPMRFTLLEKLSVTSQLSDEHGAAAGDKAKVRQRVSEVDGRIVAHVDVDVSLVRGMEGNRFTSLVQLEPGQLLVVGQSGLVDQNLLDKEPSAAAKPQRTLFYIIRGTKPGEGA